MVYFYYNNGEECVMNKTLENYLNRNKQYKTREKTDVFFPYATSF